MLGKPLSKIVGWLAGTVGILALVLSSVGTAAAQDGDMPGPRIHTHDNPPFGSTPKCVAVKWDPPVAIGEDIDGYHVTRVQPGHDFQDVAENLSANMCGLEPDTTAEFEVCAVYVSTEEELVKGCSSASLRTTKADVGSMEPQGPLPIPRVDEPIPSSLTNFGVGWKGFKDYDFYNVNIRPEGGRPWSIKHDDDGDWGWQRVDGLTPGATYYFAVRGCVSGIFGDPCSGWSPEAKVTLDLPYGPDTCTQGFVWRDGVPGDHICVTPERRQRVADDFNTGNTRAPKAMDPPDPECAPFLYTGPRNQLGRPDPPLPGCRFSGHKICLDGFVPRDIPGENVFVCVTPDERDRIAQENANPQQNRVKPQ